MFDVYEYLRKLRLDESSLSSADAKSVIQRVTTAKGMFSDLFSKKISPDTLTAEWKKNGYPLVLDDFITFLKDAGISRFVIKNTLSDMMIDRTDGSDERVTKLAKTIASSGLTDAVTQYLKKYKKLDESVWDERLTDTQIRSIFIRLLDVYGNDSTPDNTSKYVKQWVSNFNNETDETQKIQLASEIVAYLVDRQDTTEAQNMVPVVSKIIRNSDLPPSVKEDILHSLQSKEIYQDTKSSNPNREAINTVRAWVTKFNRSTAPVQQYNLASALVNFLSNQPTTPDMKYLRNYVSDIIQKSAISDSRKTSIISDIKNKRAYTKVKKPVKAKPKAKSLLNKQYSVKESVITKDQLQYIFESAILHKTSGRFMKCPKNLLE
jgi:hypothetical protein